MKDKNKIIDPNINIPIKDKVEPTEKLGASTIEFKTVLSGVALHIKDFIRWIRGSKIWEDERGYIGINSVGERVYFYLGGGLYARFQKHPFEAHEAWDYLQAEFFTGMGIYGGNFNVGSKTEVWGKVHPPGVNEGDLVPYNTYKARICGRIYLYKAPTLTVLTDIAKNASNYIECNTAGTDIEIHPYTQLKVFGAFTATGVKAFSMDHPDGSDRQLVYTSQESPDVVLRYRGMGTLDRSGICTIVPPKHFILVTEPEGLTTVNLTPMAKEQGLYVKEILKNELVTIEGKPDTKFMYEIVAIRKGYLDYNPEQDNPKVL
jgi:hypothetical protein